MIHVYSIKQCFICLSRYRFSVRSNLSFNIFHVKNSINNWIHSPTYLISTQSISWYAFSLIFAKTPFVFIRASSFKNFSFEINCWSISCSDWIQFSIIDMWPTQLLLNLYKVNGMVVIWIYADILTLLTFLNYYHTKDTPKLKDKVNHQ